MRPLDGSGKQQWDSTDSLTRVRIWIPSGWSCTDDHPIWSVLINLARLQRLAVPILLPALARIFIASVGGHWGASLASPLISAS